MATTLALTPKASMAAVLVDIAGAPAGAVTITRTDANGSASVRLLAAQAPISGAMTFYDYEAALTGTVRYDVLDSAAVTTTATTTTSATVPWISAAVSPHYSASLVAVTDYDSSREYGGTVHWVAGRRDPLVITSVMRTKEGSLSIYAGTFEDASAIEDVAATGEVLLLRQPTYTGMDMYFIPRKVGLKPRSDGTAVRRWEVSVDYTEVKVPSGPLVSAAGWDFAHITAVGTFSQILTNFPTFKALVVGP